MDRKTKRKITKIVASACEGHEKFSQLTVLGFIRLCWITFAALMGCFSLLSYFFGIMAKHYPWWGYLPPMIIAIMASFHARYVAEKILLGIWQEWQQQTPTAETFEAAITNNIPDILKDMDNGKDK